MQSVCYLAQAAGRVGFKNPRVHQVVFLISSYSLVENVLISENVLIGTKTSIQSLDHFHDTIPMKHSVETLISLHYNRPLHLGCLRRLTLLCFKPLMCLHTANLCH